VRFHGGENLKKTLLTIAVIVGAFLFGNVVVAPFIVLLLIPTTGTVVYGPPELTFSPSSIDWGTVIVDENVSRSVNITNTGGPTGILNMSTANASANLLNYSLTWDLIDWFLESDESVLANFTLTIYEANTTVTNDFNFNIIIGEQS